MNTRIRLLTLAALTTTSLSLSPMAAAAPEDVSSLFATATIELCVPTSIARHDEAGADKCTWSSPSGPLNGVPVQVTYPTGTSGMRFPLVGIAMGGGDFNTYHGSTSNCRKGSDPQALGYATGTGGVCSEPDTSYPNTAPFKDTAWLQMAKVLASRGMVVAVPRLITEAFFSGVNALDGQAFYNILTSLAAPDSPVLAGTPLAGKIGGARMAVVGYSAGAPVAAYAAAFDQRELYELGQCRVVITPYEFDPIGGGVSGGQAQLICAWDDPVFGPHSIVSFVSLEPIDVPTCSPGQTGTCDVACNSNADCEGGLQCLDASSGAGKRCYGQGLPMNFSASVVLLQMVSETTARRVRHDHSGAVGGRSYPHVNWLSNTRGPKVSMVASVGTTRTWAAAAKYSNHCTPRAGHVSSPTASQHTNSSSALCEGPSLFRSAGPSENCAAGEEDCGFDQVYERSGTREPYTMYQRYVSAFVGCALGTVAARAETCGWVEGVRLANNTDVNSENINLYGARCETSSGATDCGTFDNCSTDADCGKWCNQGSRAGYACSGTGDCPGGSCLSETCMDLKRCLASEKVCSTDADCPGEGTGSCATRKQCTTGCSLASTPSGSGYYCSRPEGPVGLLDYYVLPTGLRDIRVVDVSPVNPWCVPGITCP